jgi:hypothetical protein
MEWERILPHLVSVNASRTAVEIVDGSGIRHKTLQNVLAAMN